MSRYVLHADNMEPNNRHGICTGGETKREIIERINFCKKHWKKPVFRIFDRKENKYFTEEEFIEPEQLTLF